MVFFFYGRFEQKKAKDIWFYYIQEKADISTAYISKTKQVLLKKMDKKHYRAQKKWVYLILKGTVYLK